MDTGSGNHARRIIIETAIGQCENFAEFLELVAEICSGRANDTQGIELDSEIWEKRAKLIGEVSELVEFEIQTGTTVLKIAGERIRDKYFVPIESGKPPQSFDVTDCPRCGFLGPPTLNTNTR